MKTRKNSSAKHTKGPFEYSAEKIGGEIQVSIDENFVPDCKIADDMERLELTANLIESAPTMLGALYVAATRLSKFKTRHEERAYLIVLDAIAKAEGSDK